MKAAESKTKSTSISVPVRTLEQGRAHAKELGMSLSQLVSALLDMEDDNPSVIIQVPDGQGGWRFRRVEHDLLGEIPSVTNVTKTQPNS